VDVTNLPLSNGNEETNIMVLSQNWTKVADYLYHTLFPFSSCCLTRTLSVFHLSPRTVGLAIARSKHNFSWHGSSAAVPSSGINHTEHDRDLPLWRVDLSPPAANSAQHPAVSHSRLVCRIASALRPSSTG
jgi:hypothetical protein